MLWGLSDQYYSQHYLQATDRFEVTNHTWYEGPCVAALSQTQFIVAGGKTNQQGPNINNLRNTDMYDLETNTWTTLPDIPTEFNFAQCGIAQAADGSGPELVIAGGVDLNLKTYIYNVQSMTWRQGKDLPIPIKGGASVPYDDSFLIVGGETNDWTPRAVNSIYYYNSMGEEWLLRPEKLGEANRYLAAVMVAEDAVNCDFAENH